MDLENARKKIDLIDAKVLRLLGERFELGARTKKLKESVEDRKREEDVLGNAKRHSGGLLSPQFSEKLLSEIISESKKIQELDAKLAGFQGEHGAYSEIALRKFDSSAVALPCSEFSEVFEGVASGKLDLGIVPVENSLEGAVTQVNDLLVGTELKIVGEVVVPIHHCLLAPPETDYREIKTVYSHPQALGQCHGFIARNKLQARPFYDTAGAAMMLANERLDAAGAIASGLCAELYGLQVIKENIEDDKANSTRFVVLAKEAVEGGNKCSIAFSTAHTAGSLYSVLREFSDSGINLTRIESRPVRGDTGKYAFLLDFQGSLGDTNVAGTLERVGRQTTMLRVLGCYKEAIA